MVIMPGAPAFHRVPGFAHLQSSSYSFISFHNNPNNIVNNKVPSSSSRIAEATPSSLRSRSSSRLLFESESCPPLASVPSDSIAWSPIFASPLIFFLPSLSPSPVPQSSATAAPGSQFSHRCDAPEDAQDDSQNDSPEAAPANPL